MDIARPVGIDPAIPIQDLRQMGGATSGIPVFTSAIGEDLTETSFAQFDLNVPRGGLDRFLVMPASWPRSAAAATNNGYYGLFKTRWRRLDLAQLPLLSRAKARP